jgi:endonuclease/exonuclease/phosphatase family metal-dependent hydrolase
LSWFFYLGTQFVERKLVILLLLFLLQLPTTSDSLLELGRAATLRKRPVTNNEIKVVSYNIRWRGGEELKRLAKLLNDDPEIGGASILCLQEVDRQKKRTGNSNTAKTLADELGMHYAWTAPPTAKPGDEEETGVTILSAYPLADIRRIVLPNPGPNQRRRVALGATIEINGRKWRIYSVHAETRIPLDKKMEQYNAVLQDLSQFPANTPAIVMGDFNTWEPNADTKTIKLFTNAGLKTPFGAQTTFRRRVLLVPIELHLDWVWLQGLEAVRYGVVRQIEISDHWPLWTIVKTPSPATKK